MTGTRTSDDLKWRLWERTAKDDATGCWDWAGPVRPDGYPAPVSIQGFHPGKRVFWAHRVAWELWNGPIPPGRQVDHMCGNRRCVNPFHLDAVTPLQNLLRSNNPAFRSHLLMYCKRGHDQRQHGSHTPYTNGNGKHRCRICHRDAERKRYRAANAT